MSMRDNDSGASSVSMPVADSARASSPSSSMRGAAGAVLSAPLVSSSGGVLGDPSPDVRSAAGVALSAPNGVSSLGNALGPDAAAECGTAAATPSAPVDSSLGSVLGSTIREQQEVKETSPSSPVSRAGASVRAADRSQQENSDSMSVFMNAFAAIAERMTTAIASNIADIANQMAAVTSNFENLRQELRAEIRTKVGGVGDDGNAMNGGGYSTARQSSGSSNVKGRMKVHRLFNPRIWIKELQEAEKHVKEQLARIKAAIAEDKKIIKRLEDCLQEHNGFSRTEQVKAMSVLVAIEAGVEHDLDEIVPQMKSILRRIIKCTAAVRSEYGSLDADEEREQEIRKEQAALVKSASVAEWHTRWPRPRGCSARENRAQVNALPKRMFKLIASLVGSYGYSEEETEAGFTEWDDEIAAMADHGDSEEDDEEAEEYKYADVPTQKVHRAHQTDVHGKKSEARRSVANDMESPKRNAQRRGTPIRASALKASAVARQEKLKPIVAAILNDSISAEREETADEEVDWLAADDEEDTAGNDDWRYSVTDHDNNEEKKILKRKHSNRKSAQKATDTDDEFELFLRNGIDEDEGQRLSEQRRAALRQKQTKKSTANHEDNQDHMGMRRVNTAANPATRRMSYGDAARNDGRTRANGDDGDDSGGSGHSSDDGSEDDEWGQRKQRLTPLKKKKGMKNADSETDEVVHHKMRSAANVNRDKRWSQAPVHAVNPQTVEAAAGKGINLSKVLAHVKPDEQFVFDETKIPKMNIADSFRDFDVKIKHQVAVAQFGKSAAEIKIPDSILINHFMSWLKSNVMRDSWMDSNLGSSYEARKRMFCKSYGLSRFMINSELTNCQWDGKEDLLAFNARLAAVETRYCEANKTSLDENTQVNHFIERIKAIPVLHEYAANYVQSENNQQRDVTRAELVRQVHLKQQVRQESNARREKEKAVHSKEKAVHGNEKPLHSTEKQTEGKLIEAVSQLVAQVNAMNRRDTDNVRRNGNGNGKSLWCYFCGGPHAQSECELFEKAREEAQAQVRATRKPETAR